MNRPKSMTLSDCKFLLRQVVVDMVHLMEESENLKGHRLNALILNYNSCRRDINAVFDCLRSLNMQEWQHCYDALRDLIEVASELIELLYERVQDYKEMILERGEDPHRKRAFLWPATFA